MKYEQMTIIFLLIIILFTACSPYPKLEINDEFDGVKVSGFMDFGHLNEDYHMYFKEKGDIKSFVDAIEGSKTLQGDVDMPEGDYDLLLHSNEGISEGFHLWVSESERTGTIMKIDDTATAYTLTKSSTNEVLSLLSK